MKTLLIKNWYYYLAGLIVLFGLKWYYSMAGIEDLEWIIGPTAWWTEILSGNTFKKVPGLGYVNNANEFIIVSSCSGINFLIVLFSTLLYSFIHRLKVNKEKSLWFAFCMLFSYIMTIGVNGLRIIISMYLYNADIYGALITPERVHRIEGVLIYFVSLFIIYSLIERKAGFIVSGFCEEKYSARSMKKLIITCVPPLFWYFVFTLGIPLLNRAYKKDGVHFLEHSIVIISISFISVLVYCLISKLKHIGVSDRINKSIKMSRNRSSF
ncbi:MAG: hypothetical protein BWY74_01378 [Firmicutes bacterium ADurb.Bin419]|nr:MAG: hypothetical protein BWY74_01378 [Firmicutes bacterium ADurb.Bin419]